MTTNQKQLDTVLAELPHSLTAAYKAIRYVLRNGLLFEHQQRQRELYFQSSGSNGLTKEQASVLSFLKSAVLIMNEHKETLDASIPNSMIHFSKKKPKYNWLKDHTAILRELMEKGYSYRKMEEVIKHRFRMNISHTYIAGFCKKNLAGGER